MTDLISRQEAIEWVRNWIDVNKYYHPYSKCEYMPVNEVIDRLKQVPTIEAEPKWTLCTEALPVTEDYVLCTTEKKNGERSVVRGYYTGSAWACGMNSNVVAWMPLPEPYKEGRAHGEALYPCDPSKNTECRKTGCFKNGGPCSLTRNAEYAAVYVHDACENIPKASEWTEAKMPNWINKIDPKEWQGRYCVECVYAPDCAGFGVMKNACRGFEPRVQKDKKESEQR